MTIKQRGKNGICSTEFYIGGQAYRFSFNGTKGMPLITKKQEAREYETELKKKIRLGAFIAESPLKNFARFYAEVFMAYSRKHKVKLGTQFDQYYGKSLLEAFGKYNLDQISADMIEDYLIRLSRTETKYERTFSPVTVRMHYNRLNRVFNMARKRKVVAENPCELVEEKVLQQFPSWARRERWLNKYDTEEETKLFNQLSGHLPAVCRLILNTGARPPQEVLTIEKEHINISDDGRWYRLVKKGITQNILLPPHSLLIANGKDSTHRVVPLNSTAERILAFLVNDSTSTRWLLTHKGERLASIKKGFQRACQRAGVSDLRPYDLRHTFATRLVDRGVHQYVISALLGHAQPLQGFGHESRVTPGYAHASWEAMQRAVESLEYPPQALNVSQWDSGKSQANAGEREEARSSAQAG